jgi:hypothetical protein
MFPLRFDLLPLTFSACILLSENRKVFAQSQFPTAAAATESSWWPFGKKPRAIIILFGPPGAGEIEP